MDPLSEDEDESQFGQLGGALNLNGWGRQTLGHSLLESIPLRQNSARPTQTVLRGCTALPDNVDR